MFIDNDMSIEDIAYEKYVLDWINKNVDRKTMEDVQNAYYNFCLTNVKYLSFDDYIEKYGYCGKIYKDFDTFLEEEYQDVTYLQNLLSHEEMRFYKNDIKMRNMINSLDTDVQFSLEER